MPKFTFDEDFGPSTKQRLDKMAEAKINSEERIAGLNKTVIALREQLRTALENSRMMELRLKDLEGKYSLMAASYLPMEGIMKQFTVFLKMNKIKALIPSDQSMVTAFLNSIHQHIKGGTFVDELAE